MCIFTKKTDFAVFFGRACYTISTVCIVLNEKGGTFIMSFMVFCGEKLHV